MADLAVSAAPATAPAEIAATIAFVTISGAMATVAIVQQLRHARSIWRYGCVERHYDSLVSIE
jgi:hypothetical protein